VKKIIFLSLYTLNIYASTSFKEGIRFYGGYSQNEVSPLVVNQGVFSTKKLQEFDIANGVIAKEFLKERTGHFYGGLSETKLELTEE
jgi:hypothetical protein